MVVQGDVFYNEEKTYKDYEPYIIINGEEILINTTMEIDLTQFDSITKLRSGNGVVVELCYQTKDIEYIVETINNELLESKAAYEKTIQKYNDYLEKEKIDLKDLITSRQQIKDSYIAYIKLLNKYI